MRNVDLTCWVGDLPCLLIAGIEASPVHTVSISAILAPISRDLKGIMVPPPDDVCPICHDRFAVASACQANCSHWFCAHCIMRVWQHGSTLQPCKCPICRRQITLLIPSDSRVHRNNSEAGHAMEMIEKYNRLFGGGSHSLVQRLQDLPFLIRRLLGELMNPQRSLPLVLRVRAVLAMLLSAAYVISPVDIIPEARDVREVVQSLQGIFAKSQQ